MAAEKKRKKDKVYALLALFTGTELVSETGRQQPKVPSAAVADPPHTPPPQEGQLDAPDLRGVQRGR